MNISRLFDRGTAVCLTIQALIVASLAGCATSSPMGRGDTAACTARTTAIWVQADTERDRALNDAWCSTVGEPVVSLEPAGNEAVWEADHPLLVAVWNSEVGGGDLVVFLEQELGVSCSGQARHAPPPVVLLLQEAHRTSSDLPDAGPGRTVPWRIEPSPRRGADDHMAAVADRCGLAVFYAPSARNGASSKDVPHEDKGNAILSTVPLTDPIAIDLPFEVSRKVAVAATVVAPSGSRLRLVSVHLSVGTTLPRMLRHANTTRRRQARGLLQGLELVDAVDATIIAGDFNTWAAGEATLDEMRRHFPQSPDWDGNGTRGSFPVDHIFFRANPTAPLDIVPDSYRRVDDPYGSDHHARIVAIRDRS